MADEENGLLFAIAFIAQNEVLLAVIGTAKKHIFFRKPGVQEALLHGERRSRDTSDGVSGVDFYQLLEDVVCQGFGGSVWRRLGLCDEGGACQECENGDSVHEGLDHCFGSS